MCFKHREHERAVELLLKADGVRHAHAGQEPSAFARRGLTMRWADKELMKRKEL